VALLKQAAGQGHAYAMHAVGGIHLVRQELEQAVEWITKTSEAGLPMAMTDLAIMLDKGMGGLAPDYPAAAAWFERAANAGSGGAANNLSAFYLAGHGRATQLNPSLPLD
jgi:hypothetical protein